MDLSEAKKKIGELHVRHQRLEEETKNLKKQTNGLSKVIDCMAIKFQKANFNQPFL
jgi:hypothetical protein